MKKVQSGNRREDPLSSDTEAEVDSSSLANLQEMFPDQNKKSTAGSLAAESRLRCCSRPCDFSGQSEAW